MISISVLCSHKFSLIEDRNSQNLFKMNIKKFPKTINYFLFFLIISTLSPNVYSSQVLNFIVFSNSNCNTCTEKIKILETAYPDNLFYIKELKNNDNVEQFKEIIYA